MPRTIVISDSQGQPAVIRRLLTCSGYERGRDRLVIAGDIVGAGSAGVEAVRTAEDSGAQVLVGNHELAFFQGETIDEGSDVEPWLFDEVTRRILSGEWLPAAFVDGVVITHAGLSAAFARTFAQVRGDAAVLVETINQRWRSSLQGIQRGSVEGIAGDLTGPDGPLWWRPWDPAGPLRGVTQVAGHTPLEILRAEGALEALEEQGLHLVDPFTRGWLFAGKPDPPPCRFAVIEDGRVEVCQG